MSGPSFYKNVVPLDRERHRGLRLKRWGTAEFAAKAHFVPIVAVELYEAARDYPVVFTGGENAVPVAVLGLRDGENLFVEADGRWARGTYVPMFVRRYPFILSRTSPESTDYAVCIDESFDGLSDSEGEPLFDENGNETELVARVVNFLQEALTEAERTRRFVERLKELDLLVVQSMQVKDPAGRVFAMNDLRVVDESKLKALDTDVIADLHRSGYLPCIYAHLFSLGNTSRLAFRVPMNEESQAAVGNG